MEVYKFDNSKVVLGIGYDPNKAILRLHLRSQPDCYYDYHNVPPYVYADLIQSDSMGRYYNRKIRGNHNYVPEKVMISDSREIDIGATMHNISLDEFVDLIAERLLGKLAKKLA